MGFYNPPSAVSTFGSSTISAAVGPTLTLTNTANSRNLILGVDDNFNGTINSTGGGNLLLKVAGVTLFTVSGGFVAPGVPFINVSSTIQYLGAAGGSADALTLTPAPALTAYATGAMFIFQATATNATTTPTMAISGLAARTFVKRAATALAAGDIVNGGFYMAVLQGTNVQLLNPTVP